MITKFLFHYSQEKRKILSGLIENDEVSSYDPMKRFPIVEENTQLLEGERRIISNGKVGYLVFRGEEEKYLDVNIFDGEVKIALTDNISHAACYSEEFFGAILDYAEYFGYDDDPEFVDSGLTYKNEMYMDSYVLFKNIKDASYCKINKGNKVLFVARTPDQRYYLTEKFEDASKVNKNELRRVLLINKFVDKGDTKATVSFSGFKYLSNEDNEYIYAGRNPYKLSCKEEALNIELDPVITPDYRLRDKEEAFLQLKDVSYLTTKELAEKSFYLETSGGKYVKRTGKLSYSFVLNPYDATLLNDYDIEIIKSAYKLLAPDLSFRRKNKNNFLYYEGNEYTIYNEAQPNYERGRMIDRKENEAFLRSFDISFNTSKRDKGIILICNNKYLNIEIVSKNKFKVLLDDSSYNASIFTREEADAIKGILGFDFSERSLENILLNDLRLYNITKGKADPAGIYRSIMREIISKKTAINDYTNISEIKLETEKASLEYLRRFYLKSVYDYKALFESVLTKDTKKVLIIAPRLNLELQGLELAAKNNIEVYTLNESKFGFLPNVVLDKVSYKGTYRLKFQNLSKMFINQFDLVLFGAGFNENPDDFKPTMDSIIENSSNLILLNSRILFAQPDRLNEFFKPFFSLKRKYYTYEFPFPELAMELDNSYVDYLIKAGGRIHNKLALTKEDSYYSAIRINKGKIENIF